MIDPIDPSNWPDVIVYASGPIYASVCTKLGEESTTDMVNKLFPLEGDLVWEVSEDPNFATGESNPCPCHDDWERQHVLYSC